MDLSRIKNFIKQNGDKFVMVENGEPELVVMSFSEYENLLNRREVVKKQPRRDSSVPPEETEFIPPILDDRITVKQARSSVQTDFNEAAVRQVRSAALPVRLEDIQLEDLPI